jgi:hypothetical protein
MPTVRLCVAVVLVVLTASSALGAPHAVPPSAASLAADVATLTAPGMDGRGSGSPGGTRAARTIARWLEAAGLEPGGDDGSFFQSFVIASGTSVAASARLESLTAGVRAFAVDRDWRPHGGSLEADVQGDAVFAGYGIARADGAWDDYHGVDVTGKIVMALDGRPSHLDADRATRLEKVLAARRRNAAGLILVGEALPSLASTAAPVALPSASMTRAAADRVLVTTGRTLADLEGEMAERRTPVSRSAAVTLRLVVALGRDDARDVNVLGILRGDRPEIAHEAVVVGAHYDHLGEVDGVVHPGADDNASGTAVVVGLARALAAVGPLPRTVVFALFGAEESGLVGSRHYTARPAVPLDRTAAMVNLDMVGRLGAGTLRVAGVGSGHGLERVVRDAAAATGVGVDARDTPWGPSDHLSFYRAGTPVVFFTTGTHEDYHRPSDVAARVDADGLSRVAAIAMRTVQTLAEAPRPRYATVAAPSGDAGRTGGAFLGIVADLRRGDGIRISHALPGGAAAAAGLGEGDVIVRFGGRSVEGFDALLRLIREHRPGDTVEVTYLRDGEDRSARATLGTRP